MQNKARFIRDIELFILVLIRLGLGSHLFNAEDPASTWAAGHVADNLDPTASAPCARTCTTHNTRPSMATRPGRG